MPNVFIQGKRRGLAGASRSVHGESLPLPPTNPPPPPPKPNLCSVGGCYDGPGVVPLYRSGELERMLKRARALR